VRTVPALALALALIASVAARAQTPLDQALAELRGGDPEQAAKMLAPLMDRNPGDPQPRFWYARALLAIGRNAEAAEQFRRVLKVKPGSVDSLFWLGMALQQQGDVNGARAAWKELLAKDPNYEAATEALAKLNLPTTGAPRPKTPQATTKAPPGAQPEHDRVMADLGSSAVDINDLDVRTRNVLDCTFASAPTDWYIAAGNWGTTNRWVCSPQWSWYGGRSDMAPTGLWTKLSFAGDTTVDMYSAFGMMLDQPRSYRNPCDLNITMCGDGLDLSSGYQFIVGGWQNTRSAILKNGRVLAESSDPKHLLPVLEDGFPDMYSFHRKWWNCRARRNGNLLQLYFDERLVCEARDPDPLPEGHVALWGYDDRVILARVRIYHDRIAAGASVPYEKLAFRQQTVVGDISAPPVQAPNVLGAGFEDSIQWFKPHQDGMAKLTLATPGAAGSGRCLKIVNGGPGGNFGVDVIPGPVGLAAVPIVEFDYKITPDVKVNLYASVGDRRYEVVFTGPPEGAATAQVVGQIADVKTDGQWHHARFDLAAAIRQAGHMWDPGNGLGTYELWFGNMCEKDYLMAGFGANRIGAAWCLDNFALYAPAVKATMPAPPPPPGKSFKVVNWVVDQYPSTQPSHDLTNAPSPKEVMANKSGWWWAHAAAQLSDGPWMQTAHIPVPINLEPPTADLVSPANGATAGDENIILGFTDGPCGAINWPSIKLKVAGKDLAVGMPGVTVDASLNRLVIDPGVARLSFEAGKPVPIVLSALADSTGHTISGPLSWSFTFAREKDKLAPRAPKLTVGRPSLLDADFLTDEMPPIESYGGPGGALLFFDPLNGPDGKGCLRLVNPVEGGRFGVRFFTDAFDAGTYRMVSMDYRIPLHYHGDFALYINGDWKQVHFTDNDDPLPAIGQIDGVAADNKWHHLDFNLYDMLRANDPRAPSYIVRWFVLSDWGGTMFNFRRRTMYLDNIELTPILSGAAPLKAHVDAPDAGGLAGVSWKVDQSATSPAPQNINSDSPDFTVPAMATGVYYLHARTFDKNGNASVPITRRLIIDSDRPTAQAGAPANDAHAAESEISLPLSDRGPGGIDPASIVLDVAGSPHHCDGLALVYDSGVQRLLWNCEKVQPDPMVFADGQKVRVKLVKAKDFAGNDVDNQPEWTWVMDYKMDHKPPVVATLDSPTHKTFLCDIFQDGADGWQTYSDAGAQVDRDTTSGAAGSSSCIKLTNTKQGGNMQALACGQLYYGETYPVLSFDYNFQKGLRLDLMILCNNNWYAISMTDDPAGAVGLVPGIVADGAWRHAYVDLFPLLRRVIPDGTLAIQQVIASDRNSMDNPVGMTARFDNFIIGRVGTGPVKMNWQATDATGINGYSYAVNQVSAADPQTKVGTTDLGATIGNLQPGVWFLHIRAVDGAGNWGPTRTYAILNAGPG
jgi:hypothetical protein